MLITFIIRAPHRGRLHVFFIQTDLAISFQDRAGAIQIWNMIQEVNKNRFIFELLAVLVQPCDAPWAIARRGRMGAIRQQVHLDELRRIDLCPLTVAEVAEQHLGPPPRTKLATAPLIPYPTVSNLVDVVLSLKEAGEKFPITYHRRVVDEVTSPEWKSSLRKAFHDAEATGDEEACAATASVVRALIAQNEPDVLYSLIQTDDIYMDILGMLEHDATYRQVKHRSFLSQYHPPSNRVCFPPTILDCVHLNYRVGYLRDSVLAALIDEQSFTTFASLQYSNSLTILDYICKNYGTIFSNLFPKEDERRVDEKQWKEDRNNGIKFVLEVLTMCRLMPPQDRKETLDIMKRQEVFEPILKACKDAIAEMDDVGADVAVDILVNLSMACPVAIWDFCDSEGDGSGQSAANGTDTADQVDTPGDNQSAHLPLPSLLVGLLSARPNCDKLTDEGLLSQIRDIIQLLLEPAVSDAALGESLMTTMYSENGLVSTLLRVLSNPSGRTPYGVCACYELLAYCVKMHKTGRARYLLSRRIGSVVEWITRNVRNLDTDLSAPKIVVVAGLRLALSMLYTKDPIFGSSLDKLIPVILEYLHARAETGRSGGLIPNLCLGIVYEIRNFESLLRSTLRNPTTYSYLQNLDNTAIQSLTLQARPNDEFRNKTAALPDTAAEADRFGEDREEEHWFESDDGDEEDEDVGERKATSAEKGRNYFQDSPRPNKKTSGSMLASPIEERRTPRKESNAVASLLEQYLEDIDDDEQEDMRQPSKRLKMSFDEEEFVGSDNVEQRGLFQERKETIPGAYSMSCVPNLVTDGLNVEDSDSEDEE
ncbi:hypothetical protein Pmar_PMAR019856 [Perkinsus marinus ATCC 50983]|uniref:Serine/threonine-protein phosphatase 4 regulatory subunit 3-like central domain-containing protein n=1 Tax=Perkinsus marinus (strain ATCC 50983 / TXsc) TaxID=423536 RepID=C5KBU3_PERM5|nr:hypothetical protein Pmar_PMAR019856 [Perkinsus marinus ATCC 50983]EER17974.1 hypothetical protein Pmar_PMAR019856 [Perkinsus marinus ATCC 50983]|eukprot:XP_002786178.1 hypothetical protein Pmar_PMAR019856 [Perkinsus marinus ATCC 50983]